MKELTKRIRTVLVATEEMIVHGGGVNNWGAEQERLAELQHTLAVSYRATPRLRHAWLDTMAQHHNRATNYSEVRLIFKMNHFLSINEIMFVSN